MIKYVCKVRTLIAILSILNVLELFSQDQENLNSILKEVIENLDTLNQKGSYKTFYIDVIRDNSKTKAIQVDYIMARSELKNLDVIGYINLDDRIVLVKEHWIPSEVLDLDGEVYQIHSQQLFNDSCRYCRIEYLRNSVQILIKEDEIWLKYIRHSVGGSLTYRFYPYKITHY